MTKVLRIVIGIPWFFYHHHSPIFWANYNDVSRRVVTLNGGLIRELPQNSLNSGLGIILICPEFFFRGEYVWVTFSKHFNACKSKMNGWLILMVRSTLILGRWSNLLKISTNLTNYNPMLDSHETNGIFTYTEWLKLYGKLVGKYPPWN